MGRFRHLGDELVYRGHIWDVVNGSFSDPSGGRFQRDIVRSPGAVAVVPVLDTNGGRQVVLVKQYRAAFDDVIIEIPAGMRDVDGEDPVMTAQRELQEESGFVAGSLHLLHEFLPSPGMTDARLHVYLATELTAVDRSTQGPEEDHMEVLIMDLAEAVDKVALSEIRDAKATIGLLLAERFFRSEPTR